MVVPYRVVGDSFRVEPPQLWTNDRHKMRGPLVNRSFNLHPDGKRVVMAVASESSAENKIVFVFNFFDELRRLASGGKKNLRRGSQ
jgi:hypothetical protein